jgi:hypothetical protein
MTPLNLTKQPPRSPRGELGRLCMLPRMIDIARAKLPGGDIGQYQMGRGNERAGACPPWRRRFPVCCVRARCGQ